MAKRSKEELLKSLSELLGDGATSDAAIALTEDIADTVDAGGVDWEARYNQLDAEWRKKYHDRFFSASEPEEEDPYTPDPEPEKVTFESLFKN